MKTDSASLRNIWLFLLSAGAALAAPAAFAQVPVDANGNPVEPIAESTVGAGARVEAVPAEALMTAAELEALVGPIALYPDDLLAIVLPASTYPLEIVQAARFVREHEENDELRPDDSWDDSIVALLNYPEVLEMMNEDIDWTWQLGTAVANQQADVIAAVEAFRDRAYAAGNLKTDEYQTVTENDDGVIEIEPVNEEIIYVPYYEPERVVVYQPRPVYYYYPRPYPVYYYPYPHGYNFYANYFWGVTTAFTIGWATHDLHVFHHSYWGHPYYGRTYYPYWWYRRPSITVYNTWYGGHRSERTRDHYAHGDVWRPRHRGGARPGFHRSRADYYRDRMRAASRDGYRDGRRSGAVSGTGRTAPAVRSGTRREASNGRPGFRGEDRARGSLSNRSSADTAIRFRPRDDRPVTPSAARERSSGGTGRRAIDTRRQPDAERRRATTERAGTPTRRKAPRGVTQDEVSRRLAESRSRVNPPARRETVTRSPARSELRRPGVSPAPRSSTSARASAPRSSAPRSSAPRSSAPRSSAPRSAAPRSSVPRSSAPHSTAPRSSAPRSSAPRSSAPRASSSRSSGSRARRAESASSSRSADRRARQH